VTDGVLVVGYGNTLRTDDGVGRHAADRLANDPRLDGVAVIGCHQLTPELALDVSRANLVVFVDASHGPSAGTLTIERVKPMARTETGSSHQLGPWRLVTLARDLYGSAPPDVFVVGVGVESVSLGDRLSPVVEVALPRLVDAVVELVAAEGARRGAVPVADPGHA
jgi:hydrogenase maturation protease